MTKFGWFNFCNRLVRKMKLFVLTILVYFVYSNVVEYPLLFYGFVIVYSRSLFNSGLFTLLFFLIILFKLRYRWDREGTDFSIKILLIIMLTGSIFILPNSLSTGSSFGFQRLNHAAKETNFHYSIFIRFLNLYLFSSVTSGLFLLYSQT